MHSPGFVGVLSKSAAVSISVRKPGILTAETEAGFDTDRSAVMKICGCSGADTAAGRSFMLACKTVWC